MDKHPHTVSHDEQQDEQSDKCDICGVARSSHESSATATEYRVAWKYSYALEEDAATCDDRADADRFIRALSADGEVLYLRIEQRDVPEWKEVQHGG